jgi:hypothetical protein
MKTNEDEAVAVSQTNPRLFDTQQGLAPVSTLPCPHALFCIATVHSPRSWASAAADAFVCSCLRFVVKELRSKNMGTSSNKHSNKHTQTLQGMDHLSSATTLTSTCTAHFGAKKEHDWAVGVLGPLFRTAGHTVRSQHQVTASAGQRRGDVKIKSYLQDAAGHPAWSSTCPSHTTGSEAAATCSRKVCYHILRTLTPPCVSLRSAK